MNYEVVREGGVWRLSGNYTYDERNPMGYTKGKAEVERLKGEINRLEVTQATARRRGENVNSTSPESKNYAKSWPMKSRNLALEDNYAQKQH